MTASNDQTVYNPATGLYEPVTQLDTGDATLADMLARPLTPAPNSSNSDPLNLSGVSSEPATAATAATAPDLFITPKGTGRPRAKTSDKGDILAMLGDTPPATVTAAEGGTPDSGNLFSQVLGSAERGLGGTLSALGLGVAWVNNKFGFEAEDANLAAQRPGNDLVSQFLIDAGNSLSDAGAVTVSDATSRQTSEVLGKATAAWDSADGVMSGVAGYAGTLLSTEGGARATASALAQSIGYVLGSGGVVGGVRATVARSATKAALTDAAVTGTLTEGLASGMLARVAGSKLATAAANPSFIAISAATSADTAREAEHSARVLQEAMGETRKELPVWKRMRDTLQATSGHDVTDAMVDNYVASAYSMAMGARTFVASHLLTVLSPISEGAFTRFALPQVPVGSLIGRTIKGGVIEGVAEGLQEAAQTGAGTLTAAGTYLDTGDANAAFSAGVQTPEAGAAGAAGAVLGAASGAGLSAVGSTREAEAKILARKQADAQQEAQAAAGPDASPADIAAKAQQALEAQQADELAAHDEALKAAEEAAAAHNTMNTSVLAAVTGAGTDVLGERQVFGAGSNHGRFTAPEGSTVVFSSSKGALAVRDSDSEVMYATADAATNWQLLDNAPAEVVRAAPAIIHLGSSESDASIAYTPGVDAAGALANGGVSARVAGEAAAAFADIKEATLQEAEAALQEAQTTQAETALATQQVTADMRAAQEASLWQQHFAFSDENSAFVPPTPDAFSVNGAIVGINDYAATMREHITTRLQSVDGLLTTPEALASTLQDTHAITTDEANALAGAVADTHTLRGIVAGDTKQLTVATDVDGQRTTTPARPSVQAAAQQVIDMRRLRTLYKRVLQDKATFAETGRKSQAQITDAVRQMDTLQGTRAEQTFEQLLQDTPQPTAPDTSPNGQTLRDLAAQTDADTSVVEKLSVARDAIRDADTISDLVDAANMSPNRRVASALSAQQVPGDTLTALLAGDAFDAVVSTVPAATLGPRHRYSADGVLHDLQAAPEVQRNYLDAQAQFALHSMALAIQNGERTVAELAHMMVAKFGMSADQAKAVYMDAATIAASEDESVIRHNITEAKKAASDAVTAAADAVRADSPQAVTDKAVTDKAAADKDAPSGVAKPKKRTKKSRRIVRAALVAEDMQRVDGMDVHAAEAVADEARARLSHLKNTLRITVHASAEAMEQETGPVFAPAGAVYIEPSQAGMQAEVHIIAPRMKDAAHMKRVLDHEVVGHFGLYRMLGAGLPVLRARIASMVSGKTADSALVRSYHTKVMAQYRPIVTDMLAKDGQSTSRASVDNALAAHSDMIMDETLALIAEDAADGKLTSTAGVKLIGLLKTSLLRAGFDPQNSADVGDIFSAARDFVSGTEPMFIKRHRAQQTYANQKVRDRVADTPLVSTSWLGEKWAKLVSDAVGVRKFASFISTLAPELTSRAQELRHRVETAANATANTMQAMRAGYVAPLQEALSVVKRDLSYTDAELHAQLAAYTFSRHAGERNKSYFLLNRTNGLSDSIIAQRDAIVEKVLGYATDENGRWGDAISQIEHLFATDTDAAALLSKTIYSDDYVGVSGYSARQIRELQAGIDPAFVKAAQARNIAPLLNAAQDKLLQMRRKSGVYGERGYAKIKLHNWDNYIPISKGEMGRHITPTAARDAADAQSVSQPVELLSPDIAWLLQEEGQHAKSDKGRLINGGTGEPTVNVMQSLERDVYYTAHEDTNANIGRTMLELTDAAKAASPLHAERINEQLVATTDTIMFGEKPPKNTPSRAAADTWVVHDADGNYRVMQFRDKQLALAMGSRFDSEVKGRIAKVVTKPTHFMARAFTSYNPSFLLVRQIMRDIQQNAVILMAEHKVPLADALATSTASIGYVPRLTAFFHSSEVERFAALDEARKNPADPLHNFARRYDAGGVLLFNDQFNRNNTPGAEFIQTGKDPSKVQRVLRRIDDFASAQASAMDNASRQAMFDALISNGKSDAEAATIVVDTLNFSNRSQAGRALAPFFAFAQTAMSGLDAIGARRIWKGGTAPMETTADGNGGFTYKLKPDWYKSLNTPWLAGRIAMGYGTTMLAHALMGSGEDDDLYGTRSLYQQLDAYTLMTNIVIPTGGKDGAIKVPLQVGFDSLFHAMGAAAYMMSNDPKGVHNADVMHSLVSVTVAGLSPFNTEYNASLDTSTLMKAVMPTVISPVLSAAIDKQDGEYNKYAQNKGRDPRTAGSTQSSPILTAITRALAEHSGVSVAPEVIEYMLQSYAGGIYKSVRDVERVYRSTIEGGPMSERGVLGTAGTIAGLLSQEPAYDAQQSYYYLLKNHEELRKMVIVAKSMDGDYSTYTSGAASTDGMGANISAFHTRYGATYTLSKKIIRATSTQLSDIKRQIDAHRARGTPEDLKRVGVLLAQKRAVYEQAATAMRKLYTDRPDGAVVDITEPVFHRYYAD